MAKTQSIQPQGLRTHEAPGERGFALVITISLMVLLALLAVGLLSLSTVTLRSSSNALAASEARANARLALTIALGELQKAMGPDQRVSANGSILAGTDDDLGIPNPRWMGVWDSWKAGGTSPAGNDDPSEHSTIGDPNTGISPSYEPNREDHFRSWMVSLPEGRTGDVDSATNANLAAVGKPGQDDSAVILVGNGSLDPEMPATEKVRASLVPVGSADASTGRYAWWVGDESQKAGIMDDPYEAQDSIALHERLFRQHAPASMGHSTVEGLERVADDAALGFLPSRETLGLVEGVTREATGRFHDITTSSMGVLADVREGGLKRDLSTLLERAIAPGEVFNLSARSGVEYEWATSIKSEGNDFMLYRFDNLVNSIEPTLQASVPIQDLAAYYQTYDHYREDWNGGLQLSTRDSSPPNSILGNGLVISNPDYGGTKGDFDKYLRQPSALYRSPVVVKMEMILSFVSEPITPRPRPTRADPFPDTHRVRIGFSPAVTLWNPFNVPLVMNIGDPDQQSLMFREHPINVELEFNKSSSYGGSPEGSPVRINLNRVTNNQQNELYTLFISGEEEAVFEPGEYKVFALKHASNSGGGSNYVDFMLRGGRGTNRFSEKFFPELELVPGWNPEKFIIPDNRVGGAGRRSGDNEYMMTFSAQDYISVTVRNTGGNSFSTDFTQKSRHGRNAPGVMWHYRAFRIGGRLTRGNNGANYKSDLTHLGFPGGQGGSLASTQVRTIEIPARRGQELIDAMGSGIQDAVPQPFLYFGMKSAVETHETSGIAGAEGAARRFPTRPFLHSSPLHPPFIDDVRSDSLYNYGWNWFFVPLDNILDAPVEIAPDDHGYHGGGYTAESGTTHVVQQHLPLTPPISIASLSHAVLGGYSLGTEAAAAGYQGLRNPWSTEAFHRTTVHGFGGLAPYNLQAIGNSYAHPLIPADKAFTRWTRYYEQQGGTPPATNEPFVDHSYLANKALWDEFYFSSITPVLDSPVFGSRRELSAQEVARRFFLSGEPLPNRRLVPYLGGFREQRLEEWLEAYDDYKDGFADKVARHMMVEAPFNINSTSKIAWKALFSSLKGKAVSYLDPEDSLSGGIRIDETQPDGVPIGAGSLPGGESYTGSSSDPSDPEQWTGWRALTDQEIDELAGAMVKQVKLRGPFLSLSEFVNRRLDGGNTELAVKGALQAALDDPSVSINEGFRGGVREFSRNEKAWMNSKFDEAMDGAIAYGSPAYVDQADILRGFAGQLTPRGDTFVIRAYGDAVDRSGKVVARAWCEATVQRVPEYIDAADEPHVKQSELQSESNRNFGRRLTVSRFRWLNPSEV
ncbi:hypothetical protein [Haloferula sp. A504]|uniref:hypothetical protein n=1 Tax=Haloferula sp. A504 TaxID=3373601 RepID=UPI0031C5E83D|nr:hypothetical protein [Verrucomicrobiaceae bacterium E54]